MRRQKSRVMILTRVCYGKASTPVKDREYSPDFDGAPVGTKKEWRDFRKKTGTILKFKEMPRTVKNK